MTDAQTRLIESALDPARSVVVSACAGSGKTWLLVSRIFRLLLAGARPSEILAITFTRKAAQEMTARLDRLLEAAALADDDSLDRLLAERAALPADPGERARLRSHARDLFERMLVAEPPITVTTFHSWFLQLVQRAPLSAGTLAGRTLTEGNAALLEEALQRFGARAARVATRPAPEASAVQGAPPSLAEAVDRLFAECGLDSALSLLRAFISRRAEWWAMTRGEPDPLQHVIGLLRAALPEVLREDPQFDPVQAARADPMLARDLATYRELLTRNSDGKQDTERAARIDTAAQAKDAAGWYLALRASLFGKGGRGKPFIYKSTAERQRRIGVDGERTFLELNAALTARLDAVEVMLCEQRAFAFNVAAFTCAAALLREFDRVKQQRQAIDFGDLEQHACQLLTDDDHAAFLHARLDSRYRHLLLDEFQDTNPLQWIALRAWLDAAQAAGSTPTVFLVGDPKQSIYRFRGAEARLFDDASAFLVEHYRATVLAQDMSRRCAPPVIELVNALFEAEPAFVGFRPHAAFDRNKPGRIEVLELVGRRKSDGSKVPEPDGDVDAPGPMRDPLVEARDEMEDLRVSGEAALLVDGLHRLRSECVLDDHGVARPVAWRDVLVLVRTRGKLRTYERALRDAGIPCNSSRQGGLLDTLEVRDLLALLRFLVAPHDDLALAHALRSPVFSLSDADLIAIATVADDPDGTPPGPARAAQDWHRRLTLLAVQQGASAPVKRAAALLVRWFVLAGTRPVHDLLDAIYFEADLLARYRASVAPSAAPAVEANLLALLEHALAADAGRFPTLARFVDDLADLSKVPAQEAPDEAIPGESDDAVRIMTVHGAKGLEAPIVWLLNCAAAKPPERGHAPLVEWPADAPGPTHFSFLTGRGALGVGQAAVVERAARLAEREELNLLYVAVTRAKQVLVVSGHHLRGHEASWYATLRSAVLRLRGQQDDPGGAIVHGDAPHLADAVTSEALPGTGSSSGQVVLPAPDPRMNRPIVIDGGPRPDAMPLVNDPQARAGVRYGDAFHRLIERLTDGMDESTAHPGGDPAARMRAIGREARDRLRDALQVGADDFERLWHQAASVLGSPALAHFFDPARFVRARNEVGYLDAGGQLRRIDRLVEFADEVWVIDYKTGDRASIEPFLGDYFAQIGEYAAAMVALHPGRPVRAGLVLGDGSLLPLER